MLFAVDDHRSDEIALDDLVRRRTWSELTDRCYRLAHVWNDALGVAPGAHAALVLANRVEFVELVLGAICAGITLTPVNWHLTAEEITYILGDSGASVIVTDAEHAPVVRAAAAAAAEDGRHVEVLLVGPDLEALVAAASDAPPSPAGPAGGAMYYTSGTTGRPKGVIRGRQPTLAEQLLSAPAAGRALGMDGSGAHLVTGPLYHAAPVGFALMDLHQGAPLVIMERFDAAATLALVEQRRVRDTHLVPTMFVRLLALDDEVRASADVSSLRTVLHGAAPVSVPVKQRMLDWWGDVLVEYWGGSEGGVVTLVDAADWRERPGTVGRPIPGHEVVVTDEGRNELPPHTDGILWCRNTRVADVFRYHGDEAKTAATFWGPGTYTLGDIGHVDDDGYVYLADRASHMIISGGVNIYPAEIEQILGEHPAVADVAVFGIPDDEWGEQVHAEVQPVAGTAGDAALAAELQAHVRAHLAGYKVPRSVAFRPDLGRLPSGKVPIRHLRAPYWAGRDRSI
ncbi:MAG: AMP-binding protein [Acidimicrobiales bacterium]